MQVGGLPLLAGVAAGEVAQILDDLAHPLGALGRFADEVLDVVAEVVEVGRLLGLVDVGAGGLGQRGFLGLVGVEHLEQAGDVVLQAADVGADVADRVVDLVGHAGGELADGGEFFGLHQLLLGVVEQAVEFGEFGVALEQLQLGGLAAGKVVFEPGLGLLQFGGAELELGLELGVHLAERLPGAPALGDVDEAAEGRVGALDLLLRQGQLDPARLAAAQLEEGLVPGRRGPGLPLPAHLFLQAGGEQRPEVQLDQLVRGVAGESGEGLVGEQDPAVPMQEHSVGQGIGDREAAGRERVGRGVHGSIQAAGGSCRSPPGFRSAPGPGWIGRGPGRRWSPGRGGAAACPPRRRGRGPWRWRRRNG